MRASIRRTVPGRFAVTIAAVIGAAFLVALISAAVRIRDDRLRRYGLIAFAVLIGVVYAWTSSTGAPDVDAVERFHFIQYGLLTWLFYRAWHPVGDRSALIAPVLAALLVGALDEWCQWLVPYRVGEARDVLLNSAAIACGLLFSAAVEPPLAQPRKIRAGSSRRLFLLAAATWTVFVCFFNSVHVGYEIRDAAGDRFMSTLDAADLVAASVDRANAWRGMTAPVLADHLSIEDRYLTEGLWHVQQRNGFLSANERGKGWGENRILEQFYGPVLDRPTTGSLSGHRLPADEAVAAREAAGGNVYVFDSVANAIPMYAWPKWTMSLAAAGGALLLAAIAIIRG